MTNITVSNVSELMSGIKAASPGDVILMKSGNYSGFEIRGLDFSSGITIQPEFASSAVTISNMSVRESSGILFKDLEFVTDPAAPIGTIALVDSKNIQFNGVEVHGSENNDPRDDTDGIRVLRSENISVVDSEFHQLRIAIGHGESNGLTFSGNYIHDIRLDGIRGSGSSNVEISKNHFAEFYRIDGDHSDAIQFYTGSTTTVVSNIKVYGNVIDQGDGLRMQGIFLRNSEGALFKGVQISDNLIIGGNYNGIYVEGASGVSISGNEIISAGDQASWLRLISVDGAQVTGNEAQKFMYGEVTNLVESGNTINAWLSGDSDALVSAWLQQWGEGVLPEPTPTPTPEPEPTPTPEPTPEPIPPAVGVEEISVTSAIDAQLKSGETVLKLTGSADIDGAGNDLDNRIYGNTGDNQLTGGAGNDLLEGRGGDDVLVGGAGFDTASYSQAVRGVTVDLSKTTAQNTGGDGRDTLTSIEGLSGSKYNDVLSGNSSANVVRGGAGDDRIYGGLGGDTLGGDAGADTFIYRGIAESTVGAGGRDVITDFSPFKGDRIDLRAIDAVQGGGDNAFQVVGAFTKKAGQLVISESGDHHVVSGDVDGDGRADFAIDVHVSGPIDAGSFLL